MKLTHARIQNFRCILDTGKFSIDELCCLVGKNEAGKTATLAALQSIRPYGSPQTRFDVTEDYPRRYVTNYEQRHEGDAVVVETWWEICDDGYTALCDEFGEEALRSRELLICRRYNDQKSYWTFNLDESRILKKAFRQYKLNAAESASLKKCTTIQQCLSAIQKFENPGHKLQEIESKFRSYRGESAQKKAIDLIDPLVPKFFYTSHYDRMNGQLSVKQIANDKSSETVDPGDEIFLDFLRLAGTSLEELNLAPRFEELNAKCEAASADITEQIFRYWSQNDNLEVNVVLSEGRPEDPAPFDSGAVARARVMNRLHRASVSFSERSAGFVWFFSFLVQFTMMRRDTANVIILLDEPGLTLHGKAQADLLRYIESELLPDHQVLYTTHSPFMVPPTRLANCRIVEDVTRSQGSQKVSIGTKISDDVMSKDRDTLFPLQGALGYSVTQSLFVGKNSLLVEGTSDILYLQALSNEIERRGGTPLDPRWTLCPAGGIDNLRPFVSLFIGNQLDIAVLSDQSQGDKSKIEKLRKSKILAAEKFHTIAELLDKDEADIEDLFQAELFCQIVNNAYSLSKEHAVDTAKLHSSSPSMRQVKKMESYFNQLPDTIPIYSHFRPAEWLIRNGQILTQDVESVNATLNAAEKVIRVYNELIQ